MWCVVSRTLNQLITCDFCELCLEPVMQDCGCVPHLVVTVRLVCVEFFQFYLSRERAYLCESNLNVHLPLTKFDCPEVILCSRTSKSNSQPTNKMLESEN